MMQRVAWVCQRQLIPVNQRDPHENTPAKTQDESTTSSSGSITSTLVTYTHTQNVLN